MGNMFKEDDLKEIFDHVLETTKDQINEKGREELISQVNERFYHHEFSSYIYSMNNNIWQELILIPEAKTGQKFKWGEMNIGNIEDTRDNAVGEGQSGNFDFQIRSDPVINIEWKGPNMYSVKDIAQVMMKLFSEDRNKEKKTIKVFSAILLSSITCNDRHRSAIYDHFSEGLNFALDALEININEFGDNNPFFVYIATIGEQETIKCHWGRYTSRNSRFKLCD